MSVGLFLESVGDQVSPRKDEEMFNLGSALEIGITAIGVAAEIVTESCFCFFGFCSCWFPTRKLPTTTWFATTESKKFRSYVVTRVAVIVWLKRSYENTKMGNNREKRVANPKPNLHGTSSY